MVMYINIYIRRIRGTRDYIANLISMMEKARDHQRELFMCFTDYKKAFDCVEQCFPTGSIPPPGG